MFLKVKGTADNFLQMPLLSGVREKIEDHLKRFNFSEIDTPILEYVSLFERGLGLETDVVSKEMFVMQNSSADGQSEQKERICLRPEGTAGTMRAFLDVQSHVTTPCKVFSYGPMFRYERPQKGRMREFHQMNMEIIGAHSILYDAQLIKMLQVLFSQVLPVGDFVLKLNFLGQLGDRKKFSQALVAFLTPQTLSLCADCQKRLTINPLRVLDCKSSTCQQLFCDAPKLSDFFSPETSCEWQQLQETLHELSVTFVVDERLVRGLDYYNKTVFEFVSFNLGAQSTFCGGGRYDGLAQQLGSKVEIPSLGCAMGMERLLIMLENHKESLSKKLPSLTCIIPLTSDQNKLALHLGDFLSAQGKRVDVLLDDQKMKNKMKKADQMKAAFVLILGEDEQKNNTVTVKNMVSGAEEVVPQKDVASKI